MSLCPTCDAPDHLCDCRLFQTMYPPSIPSHRKLYLVFCWDAKDWEDFLCDIFTTRPLAEADLEDRQQRDGKHKTYRVEEWEIQE